MKKFIFLFWRMSKKDLRTAWFALKHVDRPGWFLPALVLLTAYFFSPFNLAIPVLGVLDDFVLVPLVLHFLVTKLPQHIRQGAIANRPISA